MKVAVSTNGRDLDATINERFGRCPYFLMVETEGMTVEVLANNNADLSSGAGIQAASLVASNGAQAVITGNCGPKAMQVFAEAGIQVVLNQRGIVRDAVEAFKKGSLPAATRANAPEKAGAVSAAAGGGVGQPGMGMGGGRGLGGGRGMGGCGRGMGMGGGRGMGRRCSGNYDGGPIGFQQPAAGLPKDQELAELQQQADQCRQQLAALEKRIKDLA